MKALSETLRYQNRQMPLRIQRAVGCTREESLALFDDVKTWLWLCAKHRRRTSANAAFRKKLPSMRMLEHFRPIDLGWHEFILMTREYAEFCENYLDGYIHHAPAKITRALRPPRNQKANKALLETYFDFIYETLGEQTLRRWAHSLPAIRK